MARPSPWLIYLALIALAIPAVRFLRLDSAIVAAIMIAASLAHQLHASKPMLALTQHLFSGALHQLGEGADYIEVAKIVARMNGTSWD